jgi:glutamate-1-semialdehyde 2,1-aminomutase
MTEFAVPLDRPPSPPSSASLYERARRHIPGGTSRGTLFTPPFPPYAVSGSGSELLDADANELIDLHANYSSLVHGNAFRPVLDALAETYGHGLCFGLPTLAEVELAEHLAERVPGAPLWRFTGSGTEAVMAAVRASRAFTGRDLIVRFAGCYHGGSDALLQPGARGVPGSAQADVRTLALEHAERGTPERAFAKAMRAEGGRVAAVLLDLMPNRAGLHPVEPAFAELVRELTREHGALLIVDEVITFRLGVSGLHGLYGIEPDLITLGKVVGGGLPCGALGGREEVMRVFDPERTEPVARGEQADPVEPVALSGTFSANPLSMRAGLAALRALDETAIARANSLGERLHAELRHRGYAISGRGSLLKVHSPELTALWRRLYEKGVLIAADGLCCVSTVMNEATIEEAVARCRRALPE